MPVSIPQAVRAVATGEYYNSSMKLMEVSIPQAVRAVATSCARSKGAIWYGFQYRKRYALLQRHKVAVLMRFPCVSIPQAVRAVATAAKLLTRAGQPNVAFQYRKRYALLQPTMQRIYPILI